MTGKNTASNWNGKNYKAGSQMKNIKELRSQTGLSQAEFCKKYEEIPISTLRNWEQGRRKCPEYVIRLLEVRINEETRRQDNE